MPVISIYGNKDDNSRAYKRLPGKVFRDNLLAIIYHPIVSSYHGFVWNYKV